MTFAIVAPLERRLHGLTILTREQSRVLFRMNAYEVARRIEMTVVIERSLATDDPRAIHRNTIDALARR